MMDDAHNTKREDPSASSGQAICPSKKLDVERRASSPVGLSRAAVEAQIQQTSGPEYWRSLEELAGTPEFQEMLHREFPKGASEWVDSVSRRGFLQLMGASLALAGMTGCTKLPLEPIVPYVRQPEEVIPGRPRFYATAVTLGGYASPVLVESHLGRPTKIEGNDKHPASLGGTDIFTQAAILGMYDPDRSQTITNRGDVDSWSAFLKETKGPLTVQ
jgi:molybdopterin-containing oxidoreductase family iron-sulfur binding subunit